MTSGLFHLTPPLMLAARSSVIATASSENWDRTMLRDELRDRIRTMANESAAVASTAMDTLLSSEPVSLPTV